MSINEFIGFRALFDRNLYNALHGNKVKQVQFMVRTTYREEFNACKDKKLDLKAARASNWEAMNEIVANPTLVHKL